MTDVQESSPRDKLKGIFFGIVAVIGLPLLMLMWVWGDHCQVTLVIEKLAPDEVRKVLVQEKRCGNQKTATEVVIAERTSAGSWRKSRPVFVYQGEKELEVQWQGRKLALRYPETMIIVSHKKSWGQTQLLFNPQKSLSVPAN